MCADNAFYIAIFDQITVTKPNCLVAQPSQQAILMRGHHDNTRSLNEPMQSRKCFFKKYRIANANDFVDQQYFCLACRRDGKSEAKHHTTRICANGHSKV